MELGGTRQPMRWRQPELESVSEHTAFLPLTRNARNDGKASKERERQMAWWERTRQPQCRPVRYLAPISSSLPNPQTQKIERLHTRTYGNTDVIVVYY